MANIIYPPIVTVLFQFEKINNGMPLKNSKNERKLDRVRIWSPSLWNSTITIGDKSLKKGVANKKTSKLPLNKIKNNRSNGWNKPLNGIRANAKASVKQYAKFSIVSFEFKYLRIFLIIKSNDNIHL